MTDLIVKPVTSSEEIGGMLTILEQNLIQNQGKTAVELAEGGFLIHPFTSEDIQTALCDPSFIILVAKQDTKVVGYVIDYQVDPLHANWLVNATISAEVKDVLLTQKSLYHRHIATDHSAKGIGKALLASLIKMAKARGYKHILTQIAHEPVKNRISIGFHEHIGFTLLGFMKDQKVDGLIFGIYWLEL